MIQGNYCFEDLVRVDCDLPPRAFLAGAVHEVAHFTLAKQTTFGLLCFFLSQDGDFGGQRLGQTLRLLERASECTNECYARTMELLWAYQIADLSPADRAAIMDEQRRQDYYCRYRMEQLEPILKNCARESASPVFPHQLFLLALNIDVRPLLEIDLSDSKQVLRLLQNIRNVFIQTIAFAF